MRHLLLNLRSAAACLCGGCVTLGPTWEHKRGLCLRLSLAKRVVTHAQRAQRGLGEGSRRPAVPQCPLCHIPGYLAKWAEGRPPLSPRRRLAQSKTAANKHLVPRHEGFTTRPRSSVTPGVTALLGNLGPVDATAIEPPSRVLCLSRTSWTKSTRFAWGSATGCGRTCGGSSTAASAASACARCTAPPRATSAS